MSFLKAKASRIFLFFQWFYSNLQKAFDMKAHQELGQQKSFVHRFLPVLLLKNILISPATLWNSKIVICFHSRRCVVGVLDRDHERVVYLFCTQNILVDLGFTMYPGIPGELSNQRLLVSCRKIMGKTRLFLKLLPS